MRTGRLTDEQRNEICKMYLDGTNICDIAEKFDTSNTTVFKTIKKRGIIANRNPITTEELEKDVLDLYESGRTAYDISKIVNRHFATILRILKHHDIAIRHVGSSGYKHTQEAKRRIGESEKGENHHGWIGGRRIINGYIYLLRPDHPSASSNPRGNQKYVAEHRLVMEKHIGRYLLPEEHVHHINGIRDDNRIENLTIVQSKNHYGTVVCPHCGKDFVIK